MQRLQNFIQELQLCNDEIFILWVVYPSSLIISALSKYLYLLFPLEFSPYSY